MKKIVFSVLAPVLALVPGLASAGEAESCDVARQSFEFKPAEAPNPAALAIQQKGVFAQAIDQERRIPTRPPTEQHKADQVKTQPPELETVRERTSLKIPDRRIETTQEEANIKIEFARPEATEQITHHKGTDIETRRVETTGENANIKIKYARPGMRQPTDIETTPEGTSLKLGNVKTRDVTEDREVETMRPTLQHKTDD